MDVTATDQFGSRDFLFGQKANTASSGGAAFADILSKTEQRFDNSARVTDDSLSSRRSDTRPNDSRQDRYADEPRDDTANRDVDRSTRSDDHEPRRHDRAERVDDDRSGRTDDSRPADDTDTTASADDTRDAEKPSEDKTASTDDVDDASPTDTADAPAEEESAPPVETADATSGEIQDPLAPTEQDLTTASELQGTSQIQDETVDPTAQATGAEQAEPEHNSDAINVSDPVGNVKQAQIGQAAQNQSAQQAATGTVSAHQSVNGLSTGNQAMTEPGKVAQDGVQPLSGDGFELPTEAEIGTNKTTATGANTTATGQSQNQAGGQQQGQNGNNTQGSAQQNTGPSNQGSTQAANSATNPDFRAALDPTARPAVPLSPATSADSTTTPLGTPGVTGPQAQAPQAAQHTTAHSAARHTATAQMVQDQVAVHVKNAAKDGMDHIKISMNPARLGRVDVQMEIASDGRLMAVIQADSKETYDLLRQDSRSLEKALQDAGFDADSGSFTFEHRDGNQAQGEEESGTFSASGSAAETDAENAVEDGTILTAADLAGHVGYAYGLNALGNVDIRI